MTNPLFPTSIRTVMVSLMDVMESSADSSGSMLGRGYDESH